MKEIPKLIFGKKHIVPDALGDGYVYDAGAYTTSPVVNAKTNHEVTALINPLTPVRPFSSGSEFEHWSSRNCETCKKRNTEVNSPGTLMAFGGCPLELRLAIAYMDDGRIPFKTARRIGYKTLSIHAGGVFVNLSKCKEKP